MSDEPLEPDDPRAQRRRVVEYAIVFLILCVVGPFVGSCVRHELGHTPGRIPTTPVELIQTPDGLQLAGYPEGDPSERHGMLIGYNGHRRERGLLFAVHERRWVELIGWAKDPSGEMQHFTPEELAAFRPRFITFLRQNRPTWVPAFQGPDIHRDRFLWLNILGEGALWFWGLVPIWLGIRRCFAWVEVRFGTPDEFTHCPRCGYNIQHNAEPGCPECGWGRDGDEGATEQP